MPDTNDLLVGPVPAHARDGGKSAGYPSIAFQAVLADPPQQAQAILQEPGGRMQRSLQMKETFLGWEFRGRQLILPEMMVENRSLGLQQKNFTRKRHDETAQGA
jgi:hypothetical protein